MPLVENRGGGVWARAISLSLNTPSGRGLFRYCSIRRANRRVGGDGPHNAFAWWMAGEVVEGTKTKTAAYRFGDSGG